MPCQIGRRKRLIFFRHAALSCLHLIPGKVKTQPMASEADPAFCPARLRIETGPVPLVLVLLALMPAVLCPAQLPSLEETRLAAEKGDPNAQHRFGQHFLVGSDY